MSAHRSRIGSGAPSFCWVCHRQLMRAPGKGQGLFYFELVQDPGGVSHRVHQSQCLKDALSDGNKHIKEPTK